MIACILKLLKLFYKILSFARLDRWWVNECSSDIKFLCKKKNYKTHNSAGVPEKVHKLIKDRLKIPMNDKVRSLNIASSVAIVLAESLRQIKLI